MVMHLILIAGLNDKIASKIANHLRDSVGNTYFITMNRRIGSKRISDNDFNNTIKELVDYSFNKDAESFGLIIDQNLINYKEIYNKLLPSSFITTPDIFPDDAHMDTVRKLNESVNKSKKKFELAVREILKCVVFLNNQNQAKRNTTPLLLPVANYGKDIVQELLSDVTTELYGINDKDICLKDIIAKFDRKVQKHKVRVKNKEIQYYSRGKIVFKSPGKYTHGIKFLNNGDKHSYFCYLNGVYRIGAKIHNGFHYDCENISQGKIKKDMMNCCGEGEKHNTLYINIYPNDFLRVPSK